MGTKNGREKKLNPILWIPIILIPLILIGMVIIFVLNMAGISVTEWAHKHDVPVLTSVLKTDEEKDTERQLEQARNTIEKQKETISDLEMDISQLESTIDELEQEVVKLKNSENNEDENEVEGENEVTTVKQMAASFKKMKGKEAAQIIENLDEPTAVLILQELSNDVRGKILEAMDPNKAARLTKLFIESES